MPTLLSVEHLTAGYLQYGREVYAVRDVSFELEQGEFLGLAGESGCGKSTLAYAITGLLEKPGRVFGGSVLFDGRSLFDLSREELRLMRWRDFSIVMQASMNVLNPIMRIRHQFHDVIRAHNSNVSEHEMDDTIREMFKLVNVSPRYVDAYPHQLSGGMKQRVVIAMALALRPKLVIMDEPTTALDVVVQRAILQQISALRQELGFSVIFITHDLSLLVEIADSIAVMYAGRFVEKAPASVLYEKPLHPYTRGLMNSFPPLLGHRERLSGIPGHPPDLSTQSSCCAFYDRCQSREEQRCSIGTPVYEEVEPNHYVACQLRSKERQERAI